MAEKYKIGKPQEKGIKFKEAFPVVIAMGNAHVVLSNYPNDRVRQKAAARELYQALSTIPSDSPTRADPRFDEAMHALKKGNLGPALRALKEITIMAGPASTKDIEIKKAIKLYDWDPFSLKPQKDVFEVDPQTTVCVSQKEVEIRRADGSILRFVSEGPIYMCEYPLKEKKAPQLKTTPRRTRK